MYLNCNKEHENGQLYKYLEGNKRKSICVVQLAVAHAVSKVDDHAHGEADRDTDENTGISADQNYSLVDSQKDEESLSRNRSHNFGTVHEQQHQHDGQHQGVGHKH